MQSMYMECWQGGGLPDEVEGRRVVLGCTLSLLQKELHLHVRQCVRMGGRCSSGSWCTRLRARGVSAAALQRTAPNNKLDESPQLPCELPRRGQQSLLSSLQLIIGCLSWYDLGRRDQTCQEAGSPLH